MKSESGLKRVLYLNCSTTWTTTALCQIEKTSNTSFRVPSLGYQSTIICSDPFSLDRLMRSRCPRSPTAELGTDPGLQRGTDRVAAAPTRPRDVLLNAPKLFEKLQVLRQLSGAIPSALSSTHQPRRRSFRELSCLEAGDGYFWNPPA